MPKVLLTVTLITDMPDVGRRVKTILAASEPLGQSGLACVSAVPVEDVDVRLESALLRLHGESLVDSLHLPCDPTPPGGYAGTD